MRIGIVKGFLEMGRFLSGIVKGFLSGIVKGFLEIGRFFNPVISQNPFTISIYLPRPCRMILMVKSITRKSMARLMFSM